MKETPNLSYIKSLSDGNQEFELKLINVVKKEFPDEKKLYFKNLKEKKYQEVAENVHKIKHKISILGLEESYEIAVAYEDNLREDNTALTEDFQNILQKITEFLKTI